jgi:hypothetical protein
MSRRGFGDGSRPNRCPRARPGGLGSGRRGWARPVDAARQRASEISGQSPARLMELTPSVYTQLSATAGNPDLAAEERGPHRPPTRPGHRPAQGDHHTASCRTVRAMRAQDRRGSSPSPQTRRPRRTGTVTAGLGTNHGKTPTQDPHGLHRLPCFHPHPAPNRVIHGVITGELDDRKRSRPVRPGGHWKRACSAGTSPLAYRHHRGTR